MRIFSCKCNSTLRLVGKTVVITGANSGIGQETARDLYRRGARVVLACRDLEKANAAAEDITSVPPSNPRREQFNDDPGEVLVCELNLMSFASVRKCAQHLLFTEEKIHILINNAGVMMCPFAKSEDGFETHLQTNHLAHFLLTLLLFPKLRSATPGVKIINVSSTLHHGANIDFDDINLEKFYDPTKAYCQSKLANILFTRELARRLKRRHYDTTCFRGATYIFRRIAKLFIKTPELRAQTTLRCALDREATRETGLYYKECSVATPSAEAENDELALRLWNESLKFVGHER